LQSGIPVGGRPFVFFWVDPPHDAAVRGAHLEADENNNVRNMGRIEIARPCELVNEAAMQSIFTEAAGIKSFCTKGGLKAGVTELWDKGSQFATDREFFRSSTDACAPDFHLLYDSINTELLKLIPDMKTSCASFDRDVPGFSNLPHTLKTKVQNLATKFL